MKELNERMERIQEDVGKGTTLCYVLPVVNLIELSLWFVSNSAVGEAMEEERTKHREEFVKLQQKFNNEAREHSKTGDVMRQVNSSQYV